MIFSDLTRRFIHLIVGNLSWQYDYETEGRMWRRRHGEIEYRPATSDEIEEARRKAIMQQW